MIEERWHLWGKQNFWQWNQSTSWRTEILDALWHTWTHTTGQKRVLTAPASYRPCVHAPLVDNAQGKRHVTVRGNWVLDRRMTYFLRSVDQSDMKRTVSQLIQQMALVLHWWCEIPFRLYGSSWRYVTLCLLSCVVVVHLRLSFLRLASTSCKKKQATLLDILIHKSGQRV
jgi:hypothetical protein